MTAGKRIIKIKFHKIKRDIIESQKSGRYSGKKVASDNDVSLQTVRKIRLAKSWQDYLDRNEARKAKERPLVKHPFVHPYPRARVSLESQINVVQRRVFNVTAENERLQHELGKALELLATYPTRQEHEELYTAVRRVRARIESLEAKHLAAERRHRPFVFLQITRPNRGEKAA